MRTLENLQLDGGRLVFDFTNTVNARKPLAEFDYLKSYDDFLVWSEKVKLLSKKRLQVIRQLASARPKLASVVLRDVIESRENLYRLFSAVADGRTPDKIVADTFNNSLSKTFQRMKMTFVNRETEIHFSADEPSLEEPLHVVIKSAYDVLTREDTGRIRECPRCGWLFLDTSRNGKRRWCDMKVCGSREKALEYYHRKAKSAL